MLIAALALAAAQPGQAPSDLSAPLAPLAFLVGHCWQAEVGQRRIDTHCFESLYGGRFVRDWHRVGGGATYEGETIYAWNARTRRVEYTYWASDGGVSRGSLVAHDGLLDFGEDVNRRSNGSEVRIATTWRPSGDTAYDVVWTSPDAALNRRMHYVRVDAAPVRVDSFTRPDGTTDLVHEAIVAAPPAEVYRALTTAEGWRTWAVPHAWADANDSDLLETSYAPAAAPGAPTNIRQRFLLRIPNRLIAFRTVQTPAGFPHSEEYKRVTTLIELEPVGAGTRVRLSGIGYPSGTAGAELAGFFREGNRETLEQLRARFVSGPIDWAARAHQRAQAR
jgi:uncharacterized protein YndB with AHSA1/START domain